MKEDNNGDRGTWEARTAQGISGALAGFLSTFLGHPFEILKVRLQVRRDLARTRWPTWNMTKEMARLDRRLVHFYRGITANAIGSGVSWALFWPLKNSADNAIRSWKSKPNSSDTVKLTFLDTFLATAASSFAIQTVSNPIWVVKTRMLAHERGSAEAYPTTLAAITTIHRTEGFKAFYSGFWISMAGIFQGGVQFVVYDHMKDWVKLQQRQTLQIAEGSDADRLSAMSIAAVSSIAKASSITAFYPYQVVRSRMQMPDAQARYGDGIRGVAKGLYKEGKYRAFYKGLGPAIARNLPATCVTFLIYEKLSPTLTELLSGQKDEGRRAP
ncbi:unnamed protein product [Discula destructiva]